MKTLNDALYLDGELRELDYRLAELEFYQEYLKEPEVIRRILLSGDALNEPFEYYCEAVVERGQVQQQIKEIRLMLSQLNRRLADYNSSINNRMREICWEKSKKGGVAITSHK